jgi:formylglycine-generating enzyme required for sulfatase activity
MPVHGIDWIDAVVWCNAYRELLSEINGQSLYDSDYPYQYQNLTSEDVFNNGDVIRTVWAPGSDAVSAEQLKSDKVQFNNSATTVFHLPTETEWEFAVRGGSSNTGPWLRTYAGDNKALAVAWFEDNSNGHAHAPNEPVADGAVAMLPVDSGRLDIFNMSGNVWEWCMTDDSTSDPFYSSNYNIANLKRGGAYNDAVDYCANDNGRSLANEKDTDQDTGFRLVRTVLP